MSVSHEHHDGPLKYHGGKSHLAKRIVALFPPRCEKPNSPSADDPGYLHYVEPYFGGGSVLLENDPEGISEVVNDLNSKLTNFWRVICESEKFSEFVRMVQATPFSESAYQDAVASMSHELIDVDPVGCAWNFFVTCRQSLAGRMKNFASITRNRTRKGMNEQVSAWLNAIEGLPAVHARLKRVLIRNKPALEVIAKEDGPRSLFYLDPPYLHETRTTTKEYGEHEMTERHHRELLKVIGSIRGRFFLSGYRSTLYDDFANHFSWSRVDFDMPNHAAGGKEKRRMTECVWTNYEVTT